MTYFNFNLKKKDNRKLEQLNPIVKVTNLLIDIKIYLREFHYFNLLILMLENLRKNENKFAIQFFFSTEYVNA